MGANGSFAYGSTIYEESRAYKTVMSIGNNIKVLEQKNSKKGTKLPEESHTPNRIYVAFRKDGQDVKCIAQYGQDGKKIFEIHTDNHHGMKPHYHKWQNGHPIDASELSPDKLALLNRIRKFKQ